MAAVARQEEAKLDLGRQASAAGAKAKKPPSFDADESEDPRKRFDPKAPKKYKAWDKDEMMLLRKGVQKHGVGSWETIRQDPEFKLLQLRTGVQIKDKWRNLVKFRHLTEDEKEAVASRTSKLNKRTAVRSNSFNNSGAAPKQESNQLPWPQVDQPSTAPVNGVSLKAVHTIDPGQPQRLQGLQAYSTAHQDRLQAEEEVQLAQAAYDNSTLHLNEAVDRNKQEGRQDDVEGLVSAANHAMRQLVLCKHRLSLAQDIETRLMKTLQFQVDQSQEAVTAEAPPAASLDSSLQENSLLAEATGCGEAMRIMRPNLAVMTGRSQSYDAKSFARLYDFEAGKLNISPDDPLSQPGMVSGAQNYAGVPSMLPVHPYSSGTRSPRNSNCGSMPNSPLGRFRGANTGRASPLVRSFNLRDLSAADYNGHYDPSNALQHISKHIETQPQDQTGFSNESQSNSGGSTSTPLGFLYGGMNSSDFGAAQAGHHSGFFSQFSSQQGSSQNMHYSMDYMPGGYGQNASSMGMAAAYGAGYGTDLFNTSAPDWGGIGPNSMFGAGGLDAAMPGSGETLFDCMEMMATGNFIEPGSTDAAELFDGDVIGASL